LLECAPEPLGVMEMRNVVWSDWGSPKRIISSLETIGEGAMVSQNPLRFLYVG
jgi:hypothetical protein